MRDERSLLDRMADVLGRALISMRPGHATAAAEVLSEWRVLRQRERAEASERGQISIGYADRSAPVASTVARIPVPRQPQDTSIEAAASIVAHADVIRERVYQAIASRPDTDEGIGLRLRIGGNTVRPRRIELVAAGRVADTGERRKTASGRDAIVWCRL